jgi:uncharacterized protein (TIGR00369 family)
MTTEQQQREAGATSSEPWQEPVRGGFPEPSLFLSSGIDQLRAMIAGHCPAPPIARLTGMRPVEVGAGSASFAMPASHWLLSPQGLIANGTLAVLADGPLGCAIQTTLPPATPYTTSELSLRLVQPAHAGGALTARGRLVHAKRSLGLSEVFIQDQDGRLLAHGRSLCIILPAVQPDPGAREEQVTELTKAHHDSPDPYERPVAGEVLPQDVWDSMSGLEVLQAQLTGDLPRPPTSHLFGVRPVEIAEGSATFVLPATEWLCSPLRTVEGGVIAMLADAALASAIQTTVPAETALATVDLKVTFLRPARPDGRDLIASGTVVHRGRTMAVATAEVRNEDGKQVALALGSAMILPARPASLAGVASD